MEIDAPEQAVAIWTEGDHILCRFPDSHLVTFDSPQQLMITLKHREATARKRSRATIGTDGAPVQYDIDAIAAALRGKAAAQSVAHYEAVAKKGAETRERERTRLLRKDTKMQREKEAERELRELNLL